MPKEFTGWDNNSTNARPGFSRAVGRSLVPGRSGSGEYPDNWRRVFARASPPPRHPVLTRGIPTIRLFRLPQVHVRGCRRDYLAAQHPRHASVLGRRQGRRRGPGGQFPRREGDAREAALLRRRRRAQVPPRDPRRHIRRSRRGEEARAAPARALPRPARGPPEGTPRRLGAGGRRRQSVEVSLLRDEGTRCTRRGSRHPTQG